MNDLEYRMYSLVIYNVSDIQKAIQFSHALQEYNNNLNKYYNYGDNVYYFINKPKDVDKLDILKKEFIKWSTVDKTVILLNGGPTNWDIESKGMREHFNLLKEKNIPFSYFEEPDLNNALTAICFLVDERVYDKKKYPDFNDFDICDKIEKELKWKHILKTHKFVEDYNELFHKYRNEWIESVGGESNVFLREFLKDKRLA